MLDHYSVDFGAPSTVSRRIAMNTKAYSHTTLMVTMKSILTSPQ